MNYCNIGVKLRLLVSQEIKNTAPGNRLNAQLDVLMQCNYQT